MKKLLMFLILGMFMISLASAFTFDNVIKYNENEKVAKIENAFGLPFIGDNLATYELKYNTKFCGTKCYAEGEVELFRDNEIFDNIYFKDDNMNGQKLLIIRFTLGIHQEGN